MFEKSADRFPSACRLYNVNSGAARNAVTLNKSSLCLSRRVHVVGSLLPHGLSYLSAESSVPNPSFLILLSSFMADSPEDLEMDLAPSPTAVQAQAGSSLAGMKRKRADTEPEDQPEAGPSCTKRPRPTKKHPRCQLKPKWPSDWHLKREEIPDGALGLKVRNSIILFSFIPHTSVHSDCLGGSSSSTVAFTTPECAPTCCLVG